MVTRERLYAVLWGDLPSSPKSRKLDVCVSNVRRKLGLGPDSGFLLRSIYRRGYELNEVTPQAGG
ncbi:helix-turn-helix domain-containing protein [Variovorax sp. PAMC26660]|uniref:winged helix-turn-helix domain-containing protein n=1 Tax=Variovorax sp. PAMC26660 TaxID=2762322 RepID=UPI0021C49F87